ncbi:C39 family peptidase [Bacillus altitudinis]|uniref:C39 family peptidase n=1 Tax=Bacillus altitudinis TaxID=293387 RepID=UPI0035DF8DC8
MKIFIKLSFVFTLLVSVFLVPNSGYAAAQKNSQTSSVDLDYIKNKAYYKKLEIEKDKQMEKEEKAFQAKQKKKIKTLSKSNEYYTIPVTYKKQKYFNYCGVAAGVQALSFHKKQSGSSEELPSQDHFGITIGTLPKKKGTSSTYLANGLNKYKYVYKFSKNPYIVGDIAQYSKPAVKLENRIKSTLRQKKTAPIILLDTKWLKRYKGKSYRHYVTVSGYNKNADQLRLVDPNHHTKYTGGKAYWEKLGTTKSKYGVAVAVYAADVASPNPVMVW